MEVDIPDAGLLLESSAKVMAGLPTQAFAITLSDSVIEDMIKCVQDGGEIQLSLGNSPSFLFDNQTVKIPNSPDPFEYDLFQSNTTTPTQLNKLPNPTMSVFGSPKSKAQPAKRTTKAAKPKAEKPAARTKANHSTPKTSGDLEVEKDEAIANLKSSMAKVEAEKRENSTTLVDNIPGKGGKTKPGKARLLGAPVQPTPRSIPGSPALSGLGSPLGPAAASQEKVKQQRFPIIHELAVQELSFEELVSKYDDGTKDDFQTALNKVADFDNELQKWVLKKMYWKELDVFQYEYAQEGDRQKAIDNAIKQYDRMRLGASDPLWQKLLPVGERGKGICLSRIQAAIAKGPTVPAPKLSVQKTGGGSPSGGDSERDDSAGSVAKKGKGGEPMSRSSSQTSTKKKLSASEAQAKRLLANSKKPAATPTATASKASPKVSPTKPTAKAPAPKGGRVLSKEFVTDSDSDNDEVPLSTSLPKPKPLASRPAPAEKPKVVEKPKPADKTKPPEKPKVAEKPKPKAAAAAKPSPKDGEQDKERDTIRAQVTAKPTKLPAKRSRDVEDDDSSSSGTTPLSKRIKPPAKPLVSAVNSLKKRAPSDASQNSRGTSSGVSLNKSKNPSPTKSSPHKSSPLALSPPTNASDMEDERRMIPRPREREHDRETIISSASSSSGSSDGRGRKRPADLSSDSKMAKRQRVSPEVMLKAHKFKQFYVRYHELHEEISRHENPHPDKVADLVDMRDRLSVMKREIYSEVTVE